MNLLVVTNMSSLWWDNNIEMNLWKNKYLTYNVRCGMICDIPVLPPLHQSFYFWLLKAPRKEIPPAEITFIHKLVVMIHYHYFLMKIICCSCLWFFKASCLFCRKCNMNCWWYMQHICWVMIRYFSLNLVLGNIPFLPPCILLCH